MNALIVISGHLLSCPRAIKFADALHQAGYGVSILGISVLPQLIQDDLSLAASRPWQYQSVAPSRRLVDRIRQSAARILCRLGWRSERVLAHSEACLAGPLAQSLRTIMAGQSPLDLLVLSNLPAYATWLGLRRQAPAVVRLQIDLEDDHVAMLPHTKPHQIERLRRHALIQAVLSDAQLLTTAAPLMADDLQQRYGRRPVCILNVFDPPALSAEPLPAPIPALLWQSQTIGPDRGLEALIAVLGRLPEPPTLVLRGMLAPGFDRVLQACLERAKLEPGHLRIEPLCAPANLLHQTRGYRAGLAIETATEQNRQHCLTNKLFEYLAAGVPVILSQTPAHSRLLPELGEAALMIDLNDPDAAAQALSQWLMQPFDRQAAATRACASRRFNWQTESQHYLAALATSAPQP